MWTGSFNPRTLCGVRHCAGIFYLVACLFQSTHSVWSATPVEDETKPEDQFQSTHSVWSATHILNRVILNGDGFNPRTPCGVRLPTPWSRCTKHWFQSTHSVWSATFSPACYTNVPRGFNPRTPCGVRQSESHGTHATRVFQSTHSVWSATFSIFKVADAKTVSIHALRVECD